jgi:hypothetical protein
MRIKAYGVKRLEDGGVFYYQKLGSVFIRRMGQSRLERHENRLHKRNMPAIRYGRPDRIRGSPLEVSYCIVTTADYRKRGTGKMPNHSSEIEEREHHHRYDSDSLHAGIKCTSHW